MPRRRRRASVAYPRDTETAERVAAVAEAAERRYGLAEKAARWRSLAFAAGDELADGPVLALDDYSEIPFLQDIVGVPWYQYRARVRCGDGDWYAVARPAIPGYEEYNRDYLGLGRARVIRLGPACHDDLALAASLRADAASFGTLCDVARREGGLVLHPYMGIEPVWRLAESIRTQTGAAVRVLAPYPEVTRLANDKARFSEVVRKLLGADALARTTTTNDASLIAELLRAEVERSETVALKMPSCASGMGNRLFDARSLRGKSPETFHALVDRFLEEKEWNGCDPVLVVEWHRDVIESPSTQCWIPPEGAGEPEVEEVYQQFLLGEEQVFEGAMLSGLPRRIRHDLMTASWSICRVFQTLGYVGRCSFDALVVGKTLENARVKLVECNGRWGGTSTPMHLVKRVFGDFRRVPYKAQDYVDPRLRGLDFVGLMELFEGQLYDRRTGKGRVLLYNVGGITEHGKFDLAVTGRTYAEIERYLSTRIPGLVTRYLRRGGRTRSDQNGSPRPA
ncbi:MAG TPA: hypothetical protein VMN39_02285 [Longimicrobiaceae bacterium]|nr:hypothetical protein [Longimicrobiaceae bacterium]